MKDELWNKIDISRCGSLDQEENTWFVLRFLSTHDQVKAIRKHANEFKRQVRETLNISPSRLAKLVVSYGQQQIDVRVKLAQPAEAWNFFRIKQKIKLTTFTSEVIMGTWNGCMRYCLMEEEFCVAVTYTADGKCQLLLDENQTRLAKDDRNYRVQAETATASRLTSTCYRTRFQTLDSSLLNNRLFLTELQRKVGEGEFSFLMFVSETIERLAATQLILSNGRW